MRIISRHLSKMTATKAAVAVVPLLFFVTLAAPAFAGYRCSTDLSGYETKEACESVCVGTCESESPPETYTCSTDYLKTPYASAAECEANCASGGTCMSSVPARSDGVTSGPAGNTTIALPIPIAKATPAAFIGRVIAGLLGVVGSVALVMFIYGGFLWMIAGGNTETVKKARGTIVWAVVGLLVVFGSYALLNFVLKVLSGATGTSQ